MNWTETGQFTMQEASELLDVLRDVRKEEAKAVKEAQANG